MLIACSARGRLACPGPVLVLTLLAGCGTEPDVENDPALCPAPVVFPSHGCAELVGLLTGPDGTPVRTRDRLHSTVRIEVSQVTGDIGVAGSGYEVSDSGWYRLQLTRYFGQPALGGDTVTVWVRALWIDIPPTPPTRLYAADSVLTRIRLVPVGERFPVDTVHIALDAVAPNVARWSRW